MNLCTHPWLASTTQPDGASAYPAQLYSNSITHCAWRGPVRSSLRATHSHCYRLALCPQIVLHSVKSDAGVKRTIYFWQGKESSVDELGYSAILARDIDDALGGSPVQVRIQQGEETPEFKQVRHPQHTLWSVQHMHRTCAACTTGHL